MEDEHPETAESPILAKLKRRELRSLLEAKLRTMKLSAFGRLLVNCRTAQAGEHKAKRLYRAVLRALQKEAEVSRARQTRDAVLRLRIEEVMARIANDLLRKRFSHWRNHGKRDASLPKLLQRLGVRR